MFVNRKDLLIFHSILFHSRVFTLIEIDNDLDNDATYPLKTPMATGSRTCPPVVPIFGLLMNRRVYLEFVPVSSCSQLEKN